MSNLRLKVDFSRLEWWQPVQFGTTKYWLSVNASTCETIKDLKKLIRRKFKLDQTDTFKFAILLQDAIIPDDEHVSILNSDDCLCLVGKKLSEPTRPICLRKRRHSSGVNTTIAASSPSPEPEVDSEDEQANRERVIKKKRKGKVKKTKPRLRKEDASPPPDVEREVEPNVELAKKETDAEVRESKSKRKKNCRRKKEDETTSSLLNDDDHDVNSAVITSQSHTVVATESTPAKRRRKHRAPMNGVTSTEKEDSDEEMGDVSVRTDTVTHNGKSNGVLPSFLTESRESNTLAAQEVRSKDADIASPIKKKRRKRAKKKRQPELAVKSTDAPVKAPQQAPPLKMKSKPAGTRVNGSNASGRHVRFDSPEPDNLDEQCAETGTDDLSMAVTATAVIPPEMVTQGLQSRLLSMADSHVDVVDSTPPQNYTRSDVGTDSPKNVASDKLNGTRDFSLCSPLVGPPRNGDTVAYKVLELSENYCPEVSEFKVGRVSSYDPVSGEVNIEFLQPLSIKVKRGKFELLADDELKALKEAEEADQWAGDETVELPDKFETVTNDTVQFTAMIDVRLVN